MMKNPASRLLACLLSLLLTLDSASAGRWLRACWREPVLCSPAPVACPPVHHAWSSWTPIHCETGEVACGDCGAEVVDSWAPAPLSDCGCGVTSQSMAWDETVHHVSPDPQPTHAAPMIVEGFGGESFRSDAQPIEAPLEMAPMPAEAAEDLAAPSPEAPTTDGFAESRAEPAPAPDNLFEDNLFSNEPATAEAPAPEMAESLDPPAEAPADDLFGDAPAEEPADDLFSDAPAEEPADDLFGDAPAEEPADDLFGDAPAEEPADDLFGDAPAEEPADDLFGDDPAEEPADDLFGDAPAEEPADDLFGDAPAEEPADDLFGDPPAEAPADDLFGDPPAEAPADDLFGDPPAEEPADDLFGEPMEEAPADEAPAETDEFDDIFNFGAILREPGGYDSAGDRTWVDNSGRFSCVGRLVAVDGATVRLLKENGAVASVPLSRLSQSDLEFVSRQASAHYEAARYETAQRARPGQGKQAAKPTPLDGLLTAQR